MSENVQNEELDEAWGMDAIEDAPAKCLPEHEEENEVS
jgi:hypothetical protein